ncbi:MAG: nitrogen fixation protein NifQ [Candidatus Methylacidiphilaceae bacterium]
MAAGAPVSPSIPARTLAPPRIPHAEGRRGEAELLRDTFGHVVKRFASRGAFPCVPRLGLEEESFGRLLSSHRLEFTPPRFEPRISEDFWELASLLVDYGDGSEETRWVAHAVAAACLADNHLWQDLGLPDRKALTRLLERYFRPLRERNAGDMRWKKFFYKQLCERAGFQACKAPSCRECSDYVICFAKE